MSEGMERDENEEGNNEAPCRWCERRICVDNDRLRRRIRTLETTLEEQAELFEDMQVRLLRLEREVTETAMTKAIYTCTCPAPCFYCAAK